MARIVLIVPNFFSIAEDMRLNLINEGYKVELIYDRPFKSPIYHALAKYFPSLVERITEPYYLEKFNKIKNVDSLIVINGQTVSSRIYDQISLKFPNCKKILYMWDSTENRPTALKYKDFFDDIFSFDPKSCFEHNLKFLPLFFFKKLKKKENKNKSNNKIIAITYHHDDRYKIIKNIEKSHKSNIFIHLYLKSILQFFFLKITSKSIHGANKKDFKFFPMNTKDVENVTNKDDVILDIHHPNQTGLTLRSIEAIGMGLKLATSNSSISRYKIFSEKNIYVFDRHNPEIPKYFIAQKADNESNINSINKLEFRNWVKVILGLAPYKMKDYTDFDIRSLLDK